MTGDYESIALSAQSINNATNYLNTSNIQISKDQWNTARTQADVSAALSTLIRHKLLSALDDPALVINFTTVNENGTTGKANINFTTSGISYFGNGYIQTTVDEWHAAMDSDADIIALIKQKMTDALNAA
jgi:hypothetical protein